MRNKFFLNGTSIGLQENLIGYCGIFKRKSQKEIVA